MLVFFYLLLFLPVFEGYIPLFTEYVAAMPLVYYTCVNERLCRGVAIVIVANQLRRLPVQLLSLSLLTVLVTKLQVLLTR